jgi:hypothetical protein
MTPKLKVGVKAAMLVTVDARIFQASKDRLLAVVVGCFWYPWWPVSNAHRHFRTDWFWPESQEPNHPWADGNLSTKGAGLEGRRVSRKKSTWPLHGTPKEKWLQAFRV